MKQIISRLIFDSSLYLVIPKVFEGIKNDCFVLLCEFGAEIRKQLQIKLKKCKFQVYYMRKSGAI